ncbi:hypothetical protein Q5752_003255 [Cryptotrichosporon argae]
MSAQESTAGPAGETPAQANGATNGSATAKAADPVPVVADDADDDDDEEYEESEESDPDAPDEQQNNEEEEEDEDDQYDVEDEDDSEEEDGDDEDEGGEPSNVQLLADFYNTKYSDDVDEADAEAADDYVPGQKRKAASAAPAGEAPAAKRAEVDNGDDEDVEK